MTLLLCVQVGPGWVEGVDVGPMISKGAKARAERLIQDSLDAGADVLLDGRYILSWQTATFICRKKFNTIPA